MKLEEIYSKNGVISIEVFPPKNGDFEKPKKEIEKLGKFDISLISVTYGAGGSSNTNSSDFLIYLKENLQTPLMAHYTCINTDKNSAADYLKMLEKTGIENILALRGDMPHGTTATCRDFKHAEDLIKFVAKNSGLSVACAGYPEVHPECESRELDIKNLKRKVEAGAKFVYTQLFFENDSFLKYRDKITKEIPNAKIIPGVMPLKSATQPEKIAEKCNVKIPRQLRILTEKYTDPEPFVQYSIDRVKHLKQNGIEDFHFYTLNTAEPLKTILENI